MLAYFLIKYVISLDNCQSNAFFCHNYQYVCKNKPVLRYTILITYFNFNLAKFYFSSFDPTHNLALIMRNLP